VEGTAERLRLVSLDSAAITGRVNQIIFIS